MRVIRGSMIIPSYRHRRRIPGRPTLAGQDPIGKRIPIVELPSKDPWQTVVGVVGRVKQDSFDSNPRIAFYLAHMQFLTRAMTVALRGRMHPAAMLSSTTSDLRIFRCTTFKPWNGG